MQENRKRRLSLYIGIFLTIIVLVVMGWFILLVVVLSGSDDSDITYYSAETVQSICTLLKLDRKDEFCTSGKQPADNFQLLLYRILPPDSTEYKDIMTYFKDFPSQSIAGGIGSKWQNGCPP